MSEMDGAPPTKKPRLSLACNECRRRKVKCDAEYPKCRNCRTRDIECATTDPKHPGLPVSREWIEPGEKPSVDGTSRDSNGRTPGHIEADLATLPDAEISPAQQPHEMFFSHDASNRMKMMGASSSACLTRSLNLYLKRMGIHSVSEHFKHGMRHAEELQIPLEGAFPALPATEVRHRYVTTYFHRIHRLWPVYDIDATKAAIDQLASIPDKRNIPLENVPLLASAYLILSVGADEEAHGLCEDGDLYFKAAASLMGHVILMPYLPSVQALLSFAIVYRGRNKDGLGWQAIGMAIRIAQSLGLHKHSVSKPSQDHGITKKREQLFHARIWAICCCLEKTMQLESGRPSAIGSVTKDQMMGPEQRPPGLDYLQWHMGLAEYQAHISEHIYGHRPGDRTSRQILLDTARLDKALLDWSNELPPDFHPASDLFCSDEDFHIAAHLSMQYHQAMIALHRAGLIAPTSQFEAEVMKQCPNESARYRLKGSESICIKSARSIARLTVELADRNMESRILTAGAPLMACIVLAIYLTKQPSSRMQAADLELLKACAQHVKEQYLTTGQDERFAEGAVTVYQAVSQYLQTFRKIQAAATTLPTPARQSARPGGQRPDCNPPEISSPQSIDNGVAPPAYHDVPATNLLPSKRPNPFPEPAWPEIRPQSHAAGGLQSAGSNAYQYLPVGNSDLSFHVDQSDFDIGPAPFDDYNVEELWNWMLLLDANQSPLEVVANNSHVSYI